MTKETIQLLKEIQPQGGISFKDERYIKTGDGYEACIYIYSYPKFLDSHWLNPVININNAIVTVDISTDNMIEVRKNINKSMKEQTLRYATSKEVTDRHDAQQRYQETERIYEEISQLGEIVKLIKIRIFLSAQTIELLDKEVAQTQNFLESIGYKSTININETKADYKSVLESYKKQSENEYSRKGQEILSETLAGGNPFHFTSLSDPHGTYLGTTKNTGGSVLFDMFHIDNIRTSYNGFLVGKMGAGKSTTQKKLLLDMAIRGHYIRGFDPTGEYETLVNTLGGKIIHLDGSDGILNALEILPSSDNEEANLALHMSKLAVIYKFLSPTASSYELLEFEQLLNDFYVDWGILSVKEKKQYTNLSPQSYPIFSDLLTYIEKEIEKAKEINSIQNELVIEKMKRLNNIRLVISNLIKNYGYMFDGHTTIDNIMDRQIIMFNIKSLQNIKSEIFDVQIFSALSLCWANCVKIGSKMKELNDNKKIAWEDIKRFMVFIDEAHRIVNTNKLHAVEQLLTFVRESRKYFGGITLASQSIRDFVPDGSSSEAVLKIKSLFELMQYKFTMNQDVSSTDILAKVFDGTFTKSDLSNIPLLEKGECILALSSSQTVHFKVEISKEEENLFTGGA